MASLGVLGFASVATQLVLTRELLCSVQGNELVLGCLFGNWLLLTGLGAAVGRRVARAPALAARFLAGQLLVGVLPLLQWLAIRLLRDAVFLRGATPGLVDVLVGSLVVLSPFCLVSGFLLAAGSELIGDAADPAGGVRVVYLADTLGSVVGGVLFSLVLVRHLDHFALLCLPGGLNLALAATWLWQTGRRKAAWAAWAAGVGLCLLSQVDLDAAILRRQYAPARVEFRKESPYGRLVVLEQDGQLTFMANGLPLLTSHDPESAEEAAHFALAQRPAARAVLLLSGGMGGTLGEILKYGVTNLTYVELDPVLIEAGRRFLGTELADPRLEIVVDDGRRFLRRTTRRFDVVIVNVPEPATAELNRFYTAEFLASVKRRLEPGGVVCLAPARYENFLSDPLARLLATAHQTARQVFTQVLALPGNRVFLLASDAPLTADIADRLEGHAIATRYLRPAVLAAQLSADRLDEIAAAGRLAAQPNTDTNPRLYYEHTRHWLSQFERRNGWLAVLPALALIGWVARQGKVAVTVAGCGFAVSALQMVLLLAFQSLYGSLYLELGLLVAVFMAGLAVGAWRGGRGRGNLDRSRVALVVALLGLLAVLLPAALGLASRLSATPQGGAWAVVGIPLLSFGLAVLLGATFPLAAAQLDGGAGERAARLYAADLLGAWLGALLGGSVLTPLMGVKAVCWGMGGLNLIVALWWFCERRASAR